MDASLTAERVAPKSSTVWVGRILSALPALLMAFSAIMKLRHPPEVVQGFAAMGIDPGLVTVIGIVELACAVLYLIPPTAVLGAILIAAYLGGAVLAHLIAHQSIWWAPVLTAVVAWLGLYLREPRVRALFPLQKR
ncbi:MAG: DoxX family protein [Deltaproteobacteria bacterium]|nr:MAG: DoxX family protein [Deltaproteobacteria bacterium]TMB28136.1 MAG: DoxX family protein [Deltaproteobacteria bacterium]